MDVNPFEQEGLVTISNVSVVYDHKIYNVLVLVNHQLLVNSETQFQAFFRID